VGTCRDANYFDLPYVRDANGIFTTINFPNLLGGNAWAINLSGTVVGNFLNLTDDQSVLLHYHGFVRSPKGVITLFDPPGSVMTEIPTFGAINNAGAITGDYWVCSVDLSSCSIHGFVRTPQGKYTVFDAPGAGPDGNSFQGTFPQGINDLGEVSGQYADANSVFHGFVRSASGSITTFDVPTTCTTSAPPADCAFEGTWVGGINLVGTIVGTSWDEDGLPHGFRRAANGSMTMIEVPRAGYLTDPTTVNDFGQITGVAYDANFVDHGLYAIPGSQE
jgi:probable HAF family extracellular repeat protein